MALVDLRSDTVTRPSDKMRSAMASAEVGDDVFGDDPTVNRLQDAAAAMFGKEACLWVPTGCMGNEIAVKVHTLPGQEIIAEETGHILNYEVGAAAVISGVTIRAVRSRDGSGHLTWSEIAPHLKTAPPYYASRTGLICLENTHNFASGSVMTAAECDSIYEQARTAGVPVHLDGARIFNAAAALGERVDRLTAGCDSLMVTLSKGLGAPAGSLILGTREFIDEARIWRKRLGGGMRQIGILAAAGLLALDENTGRLTDDHDNAKRLAVALSEMPGVAIDAARIQTNIVIFDVSASRLRAAEIVLRLKDENILAIAFGDRIRMVTHLDVSTTDIDRTISVMRQML